MNELQDIKNQIDISIRETSKIIFTHKNVFGMLRISRDVETGILWGSENLSFLWFLGTFAFTKIKQEGSISLFRT